MTLEFRAMLHLYDVRTKPVPHGEWRCDLAVPGGNTPGSYENPTFGCRIATERLIYPDSSGIVHVRLADPLQGDMPDYFWVCEGRVVGFLEPMPDLMKQLRASNLRMYKAGLITEDEYQEFLVLDERHQR